MMQFHFIRRPIIYELMKWLWTTIILDLILAVDVIEYFPIFVRNHIGVNQNRLVLFRVSCFFLPSVGDCKMKPSKSLESISLRQ